MIVTPLGAKPINASTGPADNRLPTSTWMSAAFDMFGGIIAKTPALGAATQTYVASHSIVEGVNGACFEDCNPVTVSGDHHPFDEPMAARLRATAEDMARGYL